MGSAFLFLFLYTFYISDWCVYFNVGILYNVFVSLKMKTNIHICLMSVTVVRSPESNSWHSIQWSSELKGEERQGWEHGNCHSFYVLCVRDM